MVDLGRQPVKSARGRSAPRLVLGAKRPVELDDGVLVEAARAGDGEAFSRLFRRHADAVRTRLTRLIGPVPERDDLVQNVFIALHRALPAYRREANLSTYLHRIAVNAAYDHLRARQRDGVRRRPTDGGRALDIEELVDGATSAMEDQVAARADLTRLVALLDQLSPKKRIAFVLVAVEGCSLAEAASLIGAAEDTVKQRALHARRELLARLAPASPTQAKADEEEPS
jgi:RNA polymerase sigma-70 factor (ECF subfamily)